VFEHRVVRGMRSGPHLALAAEPVNSQHEYVDTRLSYQSILQQSIVRRDVSRSEKPILALRMRFRYARSSSRDTRKDCFIKGKGKRARQNQGTRTDNIYKTKSASKQASKQNSPLHRASSIQRKTQKLLPFSDDPSHITRRIYLPIHPSIMKSPLDPLFLTLTLGSLHLPQTHAWIFTTPRQQFEGDENFSCTPLYAAKGEAIDYQVGVFESCVLRLYNDAACAVQIGVSSRDWEHTLARPMFAFDVRDC